MRVGLDYPELLHGELIGSTGWLTDVAGQVTERLTYTAFGEPVTQDGVGYPPAASDTRYGYGGAWGYETGLLDLAGANANLPPVRLLHVGHRWYQPDIGRFVQRDPIGIAGGLNVYLYVMNRPTVAVDPSGEIIVEVVVGGAAVVTIVGGLYWMYTKFESWRNTRINRFPEDRHGNVRGYDLIAGERGAIRDDVGQIAVAARSTSLSPRPNIYVKQDQGIARGVVYIIHSCLRWWNR